MIVPLTINRSLGSVLNAHISPNKVEANTDLHFFLGWGEGERVMPSERGGSEVGNVKKTDIVGNTGK